MSLIKNNVHSETLQRSQDLYKYNSQEEVLKDIEDVTWAMNPERQHCRDIGFSQTEQ